MQPHVTTLTSHLVPKKGHGIVIRRHASSKRDACAKAESAITVEGKDDIHGSVLLPKSAERTRSQAAVKKLRMDESHRQMLSELEHLSQFERKQKISSLDAFCRVLRTSSSTNEAGHKSHQSLHKAFEDVFLSADGTPSKAMCDADTRMDQLMRMDDSSLTSSPSKQRTRRSSLSKLDDESVETTRDSLALESEYESEAVEFLPRAPLSLTQHRPSSGGAAERLSSSSHSESLEESSTFLDSNAIWSSMSSGSDEDDGDEVTSFFTVSDSSLMSSSPHSGSEEYIFISHEKDHDDETETEKETDTCIDSDGSSLKSPPPDESASSLASPPPSLPLRKPSPMSYATTFPIIRSSINCH
jgi:hypothetical protein